MKTLVLLLFMAFDLTVIKAQNLDVMTYNIRLDLASDSSNAWPHRKTLVRDLIQFYEPAIFGVQEALPHQMHYLDSCLNH